MLSQVMKSPKVLNKQKDFIFENVKPGFMKEFDLNGQFTDISNQSHQFNRFSIEVKTLNSKYMGFVAKLYEQQSATTSIIYTVSSSGKYDINNANGISFCMGGNCGNEANQYYAAGLTVLDYNSSDGAKVMISIYEPAEETGIKNRAESDVNSCLINKIKPNPATEVARIDFYTPSKSEIWLRVYDTLGKEVTRLFDGKPMQKGNHSIDFNVSGLNPGLYYLQLSDGKHQHSAPLIVH